MTNLKEQTVYIPISFDRSFNVPRCIIATAEVSPREGKRLDGGDMYLEPKQLICLSKDELIGLLDKANDEVWKLTGDGWNGEIQPLGYFQEDEKISYQNQKEEFINKILNQ